MSSLQIRPTPGERTADLTDTWEICKYRRQAKPLSERSDVRSQRQVCSELSLWLSQEELKLFVKLRNISKVARLGTVGTDKWRVLLGKKKMGSRHEISTTVDRKLYTDSDIRKEELE